MLRFKISSAFFIWVGVGGVNKITARGFLGHNNLQNRNFSIEELFLTNVISNFCLFIIINRKCE